MVPPDELEKEIEALVAECGADLERHLRGGKVRLPEHLIGEVINDALLVVVYQLRRGHPIANMTGYLFAVARHAAADGDHGRTRRDLRGAEPVDHVDKTMSAFRAALTRMDSDPRVAARIRLLATMTGSRELAPVPAADPADLAVALGIRISPATLERAVTHRSYAYENGNLPTNERLEFLGDSVLGLVVTDTLFRAYPDLTEGQLAKLRAAVVQMNALADVARSLNLGAYVRLGRGEEGTGGRDKSSILADTMEAVIGAVYLDLGLAEATALVHRLFDSVVEWSASLGAGLDWKTSLQELTAAKGLGVPDYVVQESGPDHRKSFTAAVRVGGTVLGSGHGRSKKAAEQQAAEAAWRVITGDDS